MSNSSCRLTKESLLLLISIFRIALGTRPAAQDEANLVDEIRNVVDDVQDSVIHRAHQEGEEVAQRVDVPAKAHDDAHVVEGLLDSLRAIARASARLTSEDLEEDEAPASHAQGKASPGIHDLGLAGIAEDKHEHGANQELP